MTAPLLSLRDLKIRIAMAQIVDGLGFDLMAGEILGVVGESGSGKSLSARALIGLLPEGAQMTAERLDFAGTSLLNQSRAVRFARGGTQAAMIFQDPRAALSPSRSVARHLMDVLSHHQGLSWRACRAGALQALASVQLSDAHMDALPHQLSGGECQRVGIAVALASTPRLLIADEPTSGLDMRTQAAVMDLIRRQRDQRGLSVILITHDLALAMAYCDRILVIHAGQLAEIAATEALADAPGHPYSAALLRSAPALARDIGALGTIVGAPPNPAEPGLPTCRFAPRCPHAIADCTSKPVPVHQSPTGAIRCWRPL